jgi:hypothetical protein
MRRIAQAVERLGEYIVMPFAAPNALPMVLVFLLALLSALYGYA